MSLDLSVEDDGRVHVTVLPSALVSVALSVNEEDDTVNLAITATTPNSTQSNTSDTPDTITTATSSQTLLSTTLMHLTSTTTGLIQRLGPLANLVIQLVGTLVGALGVMEEDAAAR